LFGDLVRVHRRRLGLTQDDLAAKAGLGVRSVREIERGVTRRARGSTVRVLADALGLSGEDRERFYQAGAGEADLAAPAGPTPARPIPAQLPAALAGFAGRHDYLDRLTALISEDARTPPTVVISAIAGTAGIGKSALAVHWAHRVRDSFPDGQLYVNLRGFDPSGSIMPPAEAVRGFLDALAVPPDRTPADLSAQVGLYRSLLAGRRMLVVLDNARDAEHVRPLLPGEPGCLALVTSRNDLAGLVTVEGALPVALDLLSPTEARELLARRLGEDRLAAEPDAVEEIVARSGRLPLALSIVATRAVNRPSLPLAVMADELRRARLDVLADTDAAANLRAVLGWSYQTLRPDAARLFRLLGLHPGPDISAPAAASLAGLPPTHVWPWLTELTRAHLLTEVSPGRYVLHDLLRDYASELVHVHDSDQDRHAATHRLLDHYLHSAYHATRLLEPHQNPLVIAAAQPGAIVEHTADQARALDWLRAERAGLVAAVDHAAATGFETHAWQLAVSIGVFLDLRGHWHDWATVAGAAVAAATRLGDQSVQARCHRVLGGAHARLGQIEDAHVEFERALALFRQTGDPLGQVQCLRGLAQIQGRQGRTAEALDYTRRALPLHRAAGDRRGEANSLNAIGWYHALLGDYAQTLTWCREAILRYEELGILSGQAAAWDSLGYAHHRLGDHAEAVASYRRAADLFHQAGNPYEEADTLASLGEVHLAVGDVRPAREVWLRALDILIELDHPDAEAVRAKLAGIEQADTGPDQPRTVMGT
jgi:transcriptional regulator with XRE-family HTH domain/Tfp pilus assembly protein PilF